MSYWEKRNILGISDRNYLIKETGSESDRRVDGAEREGWSYLEISSCRSQPQAVEAKGKMLTELRTALSLSVLGDLQLSLLPQGPQPPGNRPGGHTPINTAGSSRPQRCPIGGGSAMPGRSVLPRPQECPPPPPSFTNTLEASWDDSHGGGERQSSSVCILSGEMRICSQIRCGGCEKERSRLTLDYSWLEQMEENCHLLR